jgi:hypothetical protein
VWKYISAYMAAEQGGSSRQSAAVGAAPVHQQQQQQVGAPRGGDSSSSSAGAAQADCMGCRLTGLALGVGGGGYVGSRLLEQPYPLGGHRMSLIVVSGGLFVLGVGRALGF